MRSHISPFWPVVARPFIPTAATPNHALQRTAPCVTLAATHLPAAFAHPAPAMSPQPARRAPQSLSLGSLGDMTRALLLILLSVTSAAAQTWYTGDPSRKHHLAVDGDFLVTRAPIKILEPPKLTRMKVSWDRVTANWTINLESNVVLDPIYKPCWFTVGDWNGYTVRAGDRDGKTILMLVPKSYEQAITLRDALITLHKFSPESVSTEDKDAEKHLE